MTFVVHLIISNKYTVCTLNAIQGKQTPTLPSCKHLYKCPTVLQLSIHELITSK